jgi:hypothetical protein
MLVSLTTKDAKKSERLRKHRRMRRPAAPGAEVGDPPETKAVCRNDGTVFVSGGSSTSRPPWRPPHPLA